MKSLSAADKVRSLAVGAKICPRDAESNRMLALLLRGMPEIRGEVKAARREWLDSLTVRQRRWQRETRRPARARNHDSIAIRERYVRCGS